VSPTEELVVAKLLDAKERMEEVDATTQFLSANASARALDGLPVNGRNPLAEQA